MPSSEDKLQQRFEQLPEAEPEFGLDTRIKAQARAHLEQQRAQRAKRRRWSAGLASAACAAVVFVIAKPLLQSPQLDNSLYDSEIQMAPAPAQDIASELNAESPAAHRAPAKASAGGGAAPAMMKNSEAKRSLQRSFAAPSLSAEGSADQAVQATRLEALEETLDANQEGRPSLQYLLQELKTQQDKNNQKQIEIIQDLIKQYYPEHRPEAQSESNN